jgi:hypothetical protein
VSSSSGFKWLIIKFSMKVVDKHTKMVGCLFQLESCPYDKWLYWASNDGIFQYRCSLFWWFAQPDFLNIMSHQTNRPYMVLWYWHMFLLLLKVSSHFALPLSPSMIWVRVGLADTQPDTSDSFNQTIGSFILYIGSAHFMQQASYSLNILQYDLVSSLTILLLDRETWWQDRHHCLLQQD